MIRKLMSVFAAFAVLISVAAAPATAQDDSLYKKLAIQISDNNPGTFDKALNVASNFSRNATENGFIPLVEVVAFNAGMHAYRLDTSPVLDRLQQISESYSDLKFIACGDTMDLMERKEGVRPEISEYAEIVPAGVARLMQLNAQGYFVIRP